jgi:hypothetical protein
MTIFGGIRRLALDADAEFCLFRPAFVRRIEMNRRYIPARFALFIAFASVVGQVRADPITVLNPSFESPNLPNIRDFTIGNVTDWVSAGQVGVFYPSANEYSGTTTPGPANKPAVGIPDGKQVAYSNSGTILQTLPNTLTAGLYYTLTVDIGSRLDFPIKDYAIELATKGGRALAIGTSPLPATGKLAPSSVSFVAAPNDADLGRPLQIVLGAGRPQADFDNVRLDASPVRDAMNEFVPKPDPASAFTMVLKGNVRNQIDLTATGNDPAVNAFAYVNQLILNSGTSSASDALDADGNTRVTFTGTNPVNDTYSFNYGPSTNGLPHFGVDGAAAGCGGPCTPLQVVDQFWTDSAGTNPLASLTLAGPPLIGGDLRFATLFADITAATGTVGQWWEVPFTTEAELLLTLANNTELPETILDAGIYITASEIPLDSLNWPNEPPPDQPGSHFTRLPALDGRLLGPGTSIIFGVPEPRSLLLVLVGLIALVAVPKRHLKRLA